MNPPTLTPEQLRRADRLNGLPYVTIADPFLDRHRVIGKTLAGQSIRAEQCEEIWNQALLVDALEEPGAWQDHFATPEQIEILIHAERLFGCDIMDALPIYLNMPKASYGTWDQRPRVKWPRHPVN